MNKIVIGILAHVDSGKTTLSEAILYKTGEIRKIGRVDHKNAYLDNHEIERQRGITIFSKQAVFNAFDTEFTLVDTPGHVDFSSETERTLKILDYAVLVISGTDGVQNHTKTLWKLLCHYNVPTFIFINKMDISPYTESVILKNLKSKLGDSCVAYNELYSLSEEVAMCDESLMSSYLDGKPFATTDIKDAVANRRLFPCFFGSALKTDGILEFLEGISKLSKDKAETSEFGARIFKISEDHQGKRLTHMKITGGSLKVKDTLSGENINGKWQEKVNQIRIYSGEKFNFVNEAKAGTICAVLGLSQTFPGEGLGFEQSSDKLLSEPVLTYKAQIPSSVDIHTALSAFLRLSEEDPQLRVLWNEQLKEINITVMGEVQLEILKSVISERFGFDVNFGQGGISYKETISEPVLGVGHYEPLRHYSEVQLLLEPQARGEGIKFETNCSEDELDKNWQRLIMTHLKEKMHLGVLTGSPITDIKITLLSGRAHNKHTEGGDFRQATYRAVRQGLMNAKNILLEPWYNFTLEVPSENIGRAMTDIELMGGTFSAPELNEDFSIISGSAPVSKMREYANDVISYSKGKGRLSCILKGYEPCTDEKSVIDEYNYNPEADLENTPDSVFCANGAGFVVKWNEVYEYMHTENKLKEKKEDSITPTEKYIKNIATDEELLRIFEKTYGPVKRVSENVMRTKKAIAEPTKKSKPRSYNSGDEYLLIDGYNIIFAWDRLKKEAAQNLDLARNTLINIICNYQAFRGNNVILVFDAYKVKGNKGEVEKIHNIDVVYTKEAETADMYIEKVTHELGKKHKVRVATSDNLEQLIILGSGAIRLSADAFLKEIEQTEQEIKEYSESL